MGGFYHQDQRDEAAGVGLVTLFLAAALVVAMLAACACSSEQGADAGALDGSTAGANAVTLDDLAREYEMGQAYPSNGKDTPLTSDTIYGKGAGMVDLITWDTRTNVMVRHYGQVQEDGTVRWYAAETVLDEDGKPMATPRD